MGEVGGGGYRNVDYLRMQTKTYKGKQCWEAGHDFSSIDKGRFKNIISPR